MVCACINGLQYPMLQYLVTDSMRGTNKGSVTRYKIENDKDIDYYWKSRQSKDNCGNNAFHHCFAIQSDIQRYRFISLLHKERIGDLNKRNKLGHLPHEVQHDIDYYCIPQDLRQHFLEVLRS